MRCSCSIAIWVDLVPPQNRKTTCHELLERRDDEVLVLTDQLDPAACHSLGALGDLTEQEHRLVKRHGLFLNPARVAENGNTVFKHCLLYTSPSPRDRTRSRMPSSA